VLYFIQSFHRFLSFRGYIIAQVSVSEVTAFRVIFYFVFFSWNGLVEYYCIAVFFRYWKTGPCLLHADAYTSNRLIATQNGIKKPESKN
jgi:hypothetical protein